ncbi:MAG TPA: OmpA family protein [Paracoccus sp. (in: a-proteobacteria)]|uniref:OmpA family protein n=1 Tax=Paracoccus sp. TaxID=267 RepID=UPI002BA575D0|nr:OmpA family protein [Paracoccus sp. (in: a-proteobacteria)]HWL55959.1 OmpA family protein [Paracoccus sp. (in: a-proteobacteria)]
MTPPPNAQELRRAMDEKQRPRPQQRAGEQRQTPPARTEEQRRDAQRQAEQRRQQNAKARPQPQQLSPEEMRRRIDSRQGKTDLPAPEARSRPNEVMRLAASRDQAPKAAALTAGAAGNDRRDNVRERRITQENARRSDQDFRNRIEDGMRPRGGLTNEEMRRQLDRRERELRQDERRVDRRERALDRRNDYWDDYYDRDNDDDDDKGSDIAKLLLAGVAGFAVGRMLSGNRQVALNTGDRAVLTLPDGSQQIVRDDNALLYRPGSDVQTETFADGSTRTTVLRADGSRVVTIRDADTNILQRTLVHPNGTETRLMDNTYVRPVQISTLPPPQPVEYSNQPWAEDDLRTALLRESATDRRFTLGQVRDIPEVRSLVAPVNVPDVTFDSGSAALTSDQAEQLATFGKVIRDSIDKNPNEVYMIEGYTDAVGSDAANLALSDRRAESVALALTEYYQVPPENMVVQGYGEQYMLIPSDGDERDNRRVAIRRITDLLEQSGS